MTARDFRDALRRLSRSPRFTILAATILALGLGLNVAIFTVANAVLFKGLPGVEASGRIVYIGTQKDGRGCCVSYPDLIDWREQLTSVGALGAVADLRITLVDDRGLTDATTASRVTANTFTVLGYRPVLGRDFTAEDERAGAAPVVILSHRFWERRYQSDASVLGRVVRINGTPATLVGVMPRGVGFPQNQDVWIPLTPTPDLQRRETRTLWFAFGRLAPGATIDTARAELVTVGQRLGQLYPATNDGWIPAPLDFAAFFVDRQAARIYGVLWAAVGCVLLIACANVSNLLLGRALDRRREVALRLAMGATRASIVRQLLAESAMLGALGAAGGALLAFLALDAYQAIANPPAMAWSISLIDYSMDARVFAYVAGLTLVAVAIFGTVPALRGSGLDVQATLNAGGTRGTIGPSHKRIGGILVAAQVTLAIVLLAGAGAMARLFWSMSTLDIGADTSRILTMLVMQPAVGSAPPQADSTLLERLTTRLAAVPGVELVSTASATPTAAATPRPYERADVPDDRVQPPTAPVMTIGADYFKALGVGLVDGREFEPADRDGIGVAIVNARFAETAWPGEPAIGKRLRFAIGEAPEAWRTVVGIAPNLAQNDVNRSRHVFDPVVYVPYSQNRADAAWFLIRTRVPLDRLSSAVRQAVQDVAPGLPIWLGPFSLDTWLASMGTFWRSRVNAILLIAFGSSALLLAASGLYAVLAYAVGRRTHEIAVRVAIGGTPGDVLWLVLRDGMRDVVVGIVLGVGASQAIVGAVGGWVPGVTAGGVGIYAIAAAVVTAASLVACLAPARRATRVDPMVALRDA